MKRIALRLAALLFAWLALNIGPVIAQSETFTGEIIDSQCAKMGSHEHMMKMHSEVKTSKQCTLACAKMGGKFVLFDTSTNTVYQLDDQKTPIEYAGDKVKVMGVLNADTKTIHVTSISNAS